MARAKAKAISDEQIIAALLTAGTIKAAAEAVDLSERAIYDRMNTSTFQTLYKAAKVDLMRAAVFSINNNLQTALNTVLEIMQDKDNAANIRLSAAQMILIHAGKYSHGLQQAESDLASHVEDTRLSIW